jgi:hypothetical protein
MTVMLQSSVVTATQHRFLFARHIPVGACSVHRHLCRSGFVGGMWGRCQQRTEDHQDRHRRASACGAARGMGSHPHVRTAPAGSTLHTYHQHVPRHTAERLHFARSRGVDLLSAIALAPIRLPRGPSYGVLLKNPPTELPRQPVLERAMLVPAGQGGIRSPADPCRRRQDPAGVPTRRTRAQN